MLTEGRIIKLLSEEKIINLLSEGRIKLFSKGRIIKLLNEKRIIKLFRVFSPLENSSGISLSLLRAFVFTIYFYNQKFLTIFKSAVNFF